MAVNLATAYVEIIPSANGIGSSITKELGGVVPRANAQGQKIGLKLSEGIKSTLKKGALGAGAAAGATLGVALKKGFDRLSSIDQAQAKLKGLGNSAEDVSKIMDNAMAAVKGTAYGFGDAAGLAAQMVASGIKPGRELEQVLKTVGDTAAISGRELNDIGLIFGSVAARGKLQGDDMLQLMSSGIPVLQLLGDELGKTSAEVSDMVSSGKVDFETFERAMRKGMGGAALEAGKTFKGAVDNTNAALGRLGAAILDAPFKMAPGLFSKMTDGIDQLTGKVQALTKYLQTGVDTEGYMFKAFGSREQADAVIARLDDVRNKWSEFTAGLSGNDAGATGMFGSLGSSFREIGQAIVDIMPSIAGIAGSLGEAGLGASVVSLTGAMAVLAPLMADILAPILKSVADLMRENQGVVTALVTAFIGMKTIDTAVGPVLKFGGALGQAGSKAKTAATLLKAPGGAAQLLGKSFSALAPNIAKAVGSVKSVGGALSVATSGFKALGAVIAANPIGAIAVAIAAVAAGLVYFFTQTETGRQLWQSLTDFMRSSWEATTSFFSDAYQRYIKPVFDWFSDAWNGIKSLLGEGDFTGELGRAFGIDEDSAIVDFFLGIRDAISGAIDWIQERIPRIGEVFGQIYGTWIEPVVSGIKSGMDAAGAAVQWFSDTIVQPALSAIGGAFSTAWNGIIMPIVEWFTSAITTLGTAVQTVFTTVIQGAISIIQQSFSFMWTGVIQPAITAITSGISFLGNVVKTVVEGLIVAAWNFLGQMVQSVWTNIIMPVWNFMKSAVGLVADILTGNFSNIGNRFSEMGANISAIVQGVIKTAMDYFKGLIEMVQTAWQLFKDAISQIIEFVKQKIQEFVSNVKTKFDEAANKVKEFPGKIKEAFTNAGTWLINAGKEIINGLIRGIKSMAGTIGNAIRSILPGAVQGLVSFSDGGVAYANGGITVRQFAKGGREKHVAQIAGAGDWRMWAEPETGGEAYIPLARSKRSRSTAILSDVAKIFGMQLIDDEGNRVEATTPGGTGPKGSAVRAFADGGIRTAKQVRRFVEGENIDGIQAERSLQGAPYENHPGRDGAWGDCSYTQGIIAGFMLGIKPWPRNFSTSTQLSWLRSNGAHIGMGPEGSFRIGWYDRGGGQFGHTSGTLPDGTNVEMGGGNGGGAIGGGAVAWNHPQFTHHAWIPAATSSTTDATSTSTSDATANIPSSGGAATGSDPNMVPVSDGVSTKMDAAGMTGESTTWSDTIGNLAKSVVSGHVDDILKVFGIPNEIPPIMQAGKQIYVQATKQDPDGKKAQAQLETAADNKLDAEGTLSDATITEAPQMQVEKAAPGTVSKGEYKLGESFFSEEVARAAASLGMGFEAAKIAWAAVLTEAGDPPKMWASSVDTASKEYPHDAVGSDHDSSGLFQQRANGAWGDVSERMNARASAMMFLNALSKVSGWDSMDPGAAAQAVQRSAFPTRYSGFMDKAAQVMGRFKGKLPGFKNGGMVFGGRGKNLDDVLAWLSQGEMVINSDSVSEDPAMAKMLNEQGPSAVRDSVLGDAAAQAVKKSPKIELSGSLRQILAQNLHGAADTASSLVSAGVSAGFDAAGGSAESLFAAAGFGGTPVGAGAGVAGDVASWYTGQVSAGIGHAVADAALGIYDIGAAQVESVLGAVGMDRFNPAQIAESAGLGELRTTIQDSVEQRFGEPQGSGDTINFFTQDFNGSQSAYRKELAKRGKVGAR